jgi:glutamate racemase
MTATAPIAIFDSGVGGLTVAREVTRALPSEDILYLGDTARVPYGPKSPATVRRFAGECVEFLLHFRPKLVIIACNTASATAMDALAALVDAPLVGVITPGARAAAGATDIKRVGVIGTRATIRSEAYTRELKTIDAEIQVFSRACPLFVPLVEEGRVGGPVVRMLVEEYLRPVLEQQIDTLILGCTHYPVIKATIQEVAGGGVTLVDSAEAIATAAREMLSASGEGRNGDGEGARRFFVTDVVDDFLEVARYIWPEMHGPVERVEIGPTSLR